MIKDIRFSGYATAPSDYEAPDGQLAMSLNLICEDGHLSPVHPPKPILNLPTKAKVYAVHKTAEATHYIFAAEKAELALYYSNGKTTSLLGTYAQLKGVSPMGNMLIISSARGISYQMWNGNEYVNLGAKPDFRVMQFGLVKVGNLSTSTDIIVPNRIADRVSSLLSGQGGASAVHPPAGGYASEDISALSNSILGAFLQAAQSQAVSKGYFYQPFFVRYAVRLFDGSYVWHSAPVLMLPFCLLPFIGIGAFTSSSAEGYKSMSVDLSGNPYCKLVYKIRESFPKPWENVISSVDIFVTPPIYTFNQSGNVSAYAAKYAHIISADNSSGFSLRGREHASSNPDTSGSFLMSHYADQADGEYAERYLDDALGDKYAWRAEANAGFVDGIKNASLFYKIASIPFAEFNYHSSVKDVEIDSADLSTLVTRPLLTDDYQTHCTLYPECIYPFNSRLNVAVDRRRHASPFCTDAMGAMHGSPTPSSGNLTITVFLKSGGMLSHVSESWTSYAGSAYSRYLFYPDSSAYKMIVRKGSEQRTYALTPHDKLNGAYWFGGLGASPQPDADDSSYEPSVADGYEAVIPVRNKIYTSEVNNPFYFPLANINTVGDGRILALSSTAKPLSQGQFGQYPLFAFTTEGLWALSTTSSGGYSSIQPITQDVCTNPGSVTQLDGSVLFATDRGIMQIVGSNTQCISESIGSDHPFDVRALQSISNLHSMLGHNADTCMPMLPFSQFLSACGIIYDYVHQRIVIYNPEISYAYVFSLKSKQWGMVHSEIYCGVRSYPEALAVDNYGRLVDFSSSDEAATMCMMVTRPIKLDAPDSLKTVSSVIMRGLFLKDNIKLALYGSRDLVNWHLVRSSVSHCLRGFRGTPYKYFRVAACATLSGDECLHCISMQAEPRLTNKMR